MTVNDLIECLEKWDGNMPVCVAQADGTGLLVLSADWEDHNSMGPVILLSPFASIADDWESRVRALESEGLTRSDAQAVIDAADAKRGAL